MCAMRTDDSRRRLHGNHTYPSDEGEHANLATLEQWLMPDGAGARPPQTLPPRRCDAARHERRETRRDTRERKSRREKHGPTRHW